jgi:hypothetical protein
MVGPWAASEGALSGAAVLAVWGLRGIWGRLVRGSIWIGALCPFFLYRSGRQDSLRYQGDLPQREQATIDKPGALSNRSEAMILPAVNIAGQQEDHCEREGHQQAGQ